MSLQAFIVSALLSVSVPFAATQSKPTSWEVSGVIVDTSGKPLPEAEIARYFLLSQGTYMPVESLKADAQGRFSGKLVPYKLPMTYMVLDKERKLGASFVFTEEMVKSPVKIVLKPLAEISFKTQIEDGFEPTGMNVSLACPDTGTSVFLSYEKGPFRIPEGSYELSFFSIELQHYRKPFTIKSGEKLDLGNHRLELTPISKNVGKPAMPLEFAEARGLPSNFKLEDLRGKWVLLEFWGYW